MRKLLLAALLLAAAAPGWSLAKPSYAHYLKALLLQRQGLYDDALREYQAAATIDPEAPYILEQAAELALDIGQTAMASEFAQSLIRLEPDDPKGHHLMGNIRWAQGDAQGAKAEFSQALRIDPNHAETLYSMGNLLSGSDPDAAKGFFLRYLDQSPESAADVQYRVALLDHRQGRDPEALQRLKQAVARDPEFLQARYSLAQLYESIKDTAAAQEQYKALLPLDAQNAGLLARLGELSFQQGRKEEAESYFKRGAQIEVGNPAARFWLAFMAEERGDFSAAAEQLAKSAALPEDASLNLRLSYYLTQAGRLKEAVAVLTAARARWPDDPETAYFLALGLDDTGQTDKAVSTMKEVVRLKPDSREARFQLGVWYEKLNRIEDSEKEFRAVLERRPDDAVTLNYLGYSLADRGLKLAEAERMIKRALALAPDNGAYQDSLGWVHFKLGQNPQALDEIEQAIRKTSDDDSVWAHLAEIQNAMGRKGDAWFSWMMSENFGGDAAKLAPKLDQAAEGLTDAELGALYLRYFARTHGSLDELESLCRIKGSILGADFSFNGLLRYSREDGRLKLDVLGPFFFPIWSLAADARGADLGGMRLPGVKPEAFQAAAGEVLGLLRAYLQGDAFQGPKARYSKGWAKSSVESDAYSLFFQKGSARLASLKPKTAAGYQMELDELSLENGRLIPRKVDFKGPGFSLRLDLQKAAAQPAQAR